MKNYSVLAKYYDRFSQNDCDYEKWSQYLCAVATRHGVKEIADLACGTGKMTELLANGGFALLGVDVSPEMLAVASQKCRAKFVCQDIRKLKLTKPTDMAVVVNDGVNYLKPAEIPAFFGTVYANLKVGAPFVFDVSSEYKLKNVLGNNVFFVDDEDATLLWTNSVSGAKTTLNLTLFEKDGQVYNRFDENHIQYAHSVATLSAELQQAGFEIAEISADYGEAVQADSLRITFYAIKR